MKSRLKNPNYKEERHKGCDLPLISSRVQLRTRGENSLTIKIRNKIMSALKWLITSFKYPPQNMIKP